MAVVTILAIGVSVTTVHMQGVSARVRARAAASQIESVYRTAMSDAARQGLSRMLTFDRRGCSVHKPTFVEGRWQWSGGARMTLVHKVEILEVTENDAASRTNGRRDVWRVLVSEGSEGNSVEFLLACGTDTRARLRLDGYGSTLTFLEMDGV